MKDEFNRINELANIASRELPNYEIRGLFRLIEEGPAGSKCNYKEDRFDQYPIENIFGGLLLACPKGDRTNGKSALEISTRDQKIILTKSFGSSINALMLQKAFQKREYYFSIELK